MVLDNLCQYDHLIVNDGDVSRGQWDGGDAADKVAHLVSALHLAIT